MHAIQSSKWLFLIVLAVAMLRAEAHAQDAPKGPYAKITSDRIRPGIVNSTGGFHTQVQAWRDPQGGWVPWLKVLVHFPEISDGDVLLVQLKKGARKLGKPFACEPRQILSSYQENQTTPAFQTHLAYFECRMPEAYKQKAAGRYQLDLSLRQTLLEKTTPLGALELVTIDIKQGSQNKPKKIQNELRDALVGPALLYEGGRYHSSRFKLESVADAHHRAWLDAPHHDSTPLHVVFWSKNEKADKQGRHTIACLHNGKKIAGKISSAGHSGGTGYWTFSGEDKKNIEWTEHNYPLYGLRLRSPDKKDAPPNNAQWHYLDQNPGKYECKVMAAGGIQGSFTFEVQDGQVVQHACQKDLNTTDNVYLVPFVDRGMSKAKLDKKLQKHPFYGPTTWSKGCPPTSK